MEQRTWPVVVGVDGSDPAIGAVRWAAEEAERTQAPLRLVAAVPWAYGTLIGAPQTGQEHRREFALRAARADLDVAAQQAARTLLPDRIDTELRGGSANDVLHDESGRASMLVVGTRGRGGFTGLLAGSTAVTAAARARCPVTVVRGTATPHGPVVAGVDRSPDGDAALGHAFEQASVRGVSLTAVHAWREDVRDPYVVPLIDWEAVERDEQKTLDDAVAAWSSKFPGVTVRPVVLRDRAAGALVDESAGAQLVVVGSRGHGGLAGMLLGSVGRALVQHAECPVTVVRTAAATVVES